MARVHRAEMKRRSSHELSGLGAEKISGADSCSRALEIPPSQNSKASGRRGTVRCNGRNH